MKRLFIFIFTFIHLHICTFIFAQQTKIDSLLTALKKSKEDTNKVNALNNLAFTYVSVAADTALLFAQQAYVVAQKLAFQKGSGDGLNNIGLAYYYQSNFSKALDFFSQSLKIRSALGIKSDLAFTLMGIGNVYDSQGIYDKALDFLLQALKIREVLHDSNGVAKTLNNIGIIYWRQGNLDKALECHQQALVIRKKTGDKAGIAYSLGNLGLVCEDKGNKNQDTAEFQKALEYYKQALKIMRDTMPDGSTVGNLYAIAVSLNNIGSSYDNLLRPDKAVDYYLQSLKIREQINDKDGIVSCLLNIGTTYNKHGSFDKARDYLNKSLKVSKEINSKDALKSCYEAFSYLYVNLKDFKKAYEYHQLYSQFKDSLFNEESSKQITEMQTKYETEKKEQQITLLNKDKELQDAQLNRQKIVIWSVISGLLIVVLLSIFIFRERRKSEKLLLNILPAETAKELKANGKAKAKHYESVTVMFTDFKGFTTIAEKLSAEELVSELDFLFKKFDEIISRYNIEKIKTIGDAYMCASVFP